MAIRGTTELEKVGAHECEHVYSIHGLTHSTHFECIRCGHTCSEAWFLKNGSESLMK